jgi:acetyltransferase-like isoleucine patch superfamily enzyme
MKFLNKFLNELHEICETFFSILPGFLGRYIRQAYYKLVLGSLGDNFVCYIRCRIQSPNAVSIGQRCQMNVGTIIAANNCKGGGVIIGDDVLIGPGVLLHSGNHIYRDSNININKQGHIFQEILIDDDVWIGAKSIVLSGVTIGKGCVIAAGSVVTKDTEPYGLYAGIPARRIKERNDND